MEISKDILNTGRNVTGDRLYSAIDTTEELYQKKTTYVKTIIPNYCHFLSGLQIPSYDSIVLPKTP